MGYLHIYYLFCNQIDNEFCKPGDKLGEHHCYFKKLQSKEPRNKYFKLLPRRYLGPMQSFTRIQQMLFAIFHF
jgi:hypothetical protein